jgi:hypothetical protein
MAELKFIPVLRGWFKRVPLFVALMSGIFSLYRELYGYYSGHLPPRNLFWSCVLMALIISSTVAWWQEHAEVVRLKANAKVPDIDVKLKEVALQPLWGDKTGVAWVVVHIRLHNTTPECPTTIDDYQVVLTIEGKEYDGQVRSVESFAETFTYPVVVQIYKDGLRDIRDLITQDKPLKRSSPVDGHLVFFFHNLPRWPIVNDVPISGEHPTMGGRLKDTTEKLTVVVTDPFGKKHFGYATQPWPQIG